MKAFRDSKIVQKAEDIFENAARGLPMTLDDVCDARDYLITMITLKMDTRPGALEKVTLSHYEKRKQTPRQGIQCYGTGNAVLSKNDAKHTLHQKRRFSTRFRETVITNPV